VGGARKHVVGYLSDFLFPPQRARAKVSSLSGGERNRLLLARLFTRPANVLVLDEPTNDLDMETLELLEALLQDYGGTLFLVSHDRAFLDNVVTQVIAFEGEGIVGEYAGGYSDWVQQSRATAVQRERRAERSPAAARSVRQPARAPKMSHRELRELEALPEKIAALEKEQGQISAELADPAVYRDAPEQVKSLRERFGAIEEELMQCLAKWEELEARQGKPPPTQTSP
jgi:ATP-binding cassette subfamily F protein uup